MLKQVQHDCWGTVRHAELVSASRIVLQSTPPTKALYNPLASQ
jgi:hypothetical protein